MCRFKIFKILIFIIPPSFNTSYVSVQGIVVVSIISKPPSFNTSYVSVQDSDARYFHHTRLQFQYILCVGSRQEGMQKMKMQMEFQYILCVGSRHLLESVRHCLHVSIHPMCRFKFFCNLDINFSISFNTSYVSVQETPNYFISTHFQVSIHPMCRFKGLKIGVCLMKIEFQYILCVGSRQVEPSPTLILTVSIHPMCRFKSRYRIKINACSSFQYILCVGSS